MEIKPHKIMTLFFLSIVTFVHAETSIEVKKVSDNDYKLTLKSDDVHSVSAAQVSLIDRASQLCGNLHVVLGRYTFSKFDSIASDSDHAQDVFEMVQDLTCENEPQTPQISNHVEKIDEPDQLLEKAQRVFDKYTSFLNKKKYKLAYQLLSEGNQRITPYKYWRKNKKAFRKESGGSGTYENLKLTWYDNPPNAEEQGIYVAFDYTCVFPKLEHCSGVLILHQTLSGDFEIIREEFNLMDKKTAASMEKINLSIKPFKTADISIQQWQDYLQLVLFKYPDTAYEIKGQCIDQIIAEDIGAWFYFTQVCHPAHPSWATIYLQQEGGALSLGQIGYFAGDESVFAQFFQEIGKVRQSMINGFKNQ